MGIYILDEHTDEVTSLIIFDGKLFSCSKDKTIKVWDLNSKRCLQTLPWNNNAEFLAVFNGKLYLKHHVGQIEIWDFIAEDHAIFGEIIDLFRTSTPKISEEECSSCSSGDEGTGSGSLTDIWSSDEEIDIRADAVSQAMERFSRMPQKAKNKIYGELHSILGLSSDDLKNAEYSFLGQHGFGSTPEQKAQAIERYLESQSN